MVRAIDNCSIYEFEINRFIVGDPKMTNVAAGFFGKEIETYCINSDPDSPYPGGCAPDEIRRAAAACNDVNGFIDYNNNGEFDRLDRNEYIVDQVSDKVYFFSACMCRKYSNDHILIVNEIKKQLKTTKSELQIELLNAWGFQFRIFEKDLATIKARIDKLPEDDAGEVKLLSDSIDQLKVQLESLKKDFEEVKSNE